MLRTSIVQALLVLTLTVGGSDRRPDELQATERQRPPWRGILARPERVTPEFLATWKSRGVTAVVVPLDETSKRGWRELSTQVERAGLTLWPWIEVARNPAMADAHPTWMAAIGAHHDDWRRRFPDAPKTAPDTVIKAWPWVPLGYAEPLQAHRDRLRALLDDLPGAWGGVLLNDLQAGPSSCGCGNDQCRWALDYGAPATAVRAPEGAAAQLVAELQERLPGKTVVPVWVTECETIDLPHAPGGTGYCGTVGCATGTCWPSYARDWNRLLDVAQGPVAVALWTGAFRRDRDRWPETALALFREAPADARPIGPDRAVAVLQAWEMPSEAIDALRQRIDQTGSGWLLVLDPIDQSWQPRAVPLPE
jgi:hypothetical protein